VLSPDGTAATCMATLKGHRDWVSSVACHASAPLLATGSNDGTANLCKQWVSALRSLKSFFMTAKLYYL
jgi:hypothetical protein